MAAPMRKTFCASRRHFNLVQRRLHTMSAIELNALCRGCGRILKHYGPSSERFTLQLLGRVFSSFAQQDEVLSKGSNSIVKCLAVQHTNSFQPKQTCTIHTLASHQRTDIVTAAAHCNLRNVAKRTFAVSRLCYAKQDIGCERKDRQKEELEEKEVEVDEKENIMTIPNLLTTSRILLTPVIGYLVVHESFTWALGLFVYAGITDLLDGYIARNFKNQTSALGTALDPLADKILVTVLTLSVTAAELLPVPLAVVIVGRDVLLVAAAFYIRYISLPPPKTLARYFDVTNATAKLYPSTLSKVNTALQLSLVTLTLAAPVFEFVNHPGLQALWVVTGFTTLASGVDYIRTRNKNVKFLKKGMQRKF